MAYGQVTGFNAALTLRILLGPAAVLMMRCLMFSAVDVGHFALSRVAAPVTNGAEIDVPLMRQYQ